MSWLMFHGTTPELEAAEQERVPLAPLDIPSNPEKEWSPIIASGFVIAEEIPTTRRPRRRPYDP